MSWRQKVIDFCNHYNIPINFLAETLNEPKVVPMIRGKAFEFSAYEKLLEILDNQIWLVEKPTINAQFGFHDEDVRVTHIATGRVISIECKLAAKGRFSKSRDNSFNIPVKCMRSRTLGDARIAQLAPIIGATEPVLKIHNDQYVPSDFDVVLTSIGNAFYVTNPDTDMFEWSPSEAGIEFLKKMFDTENEEELKNLAFNRMYVTTSETIAIKNGSWHDCTRRACDNQQNCGFIPNYPKIYFPPFEDNEFSDASNGWSKIENAENVFASLINQ